MDTDLQVPKYLRWGYVDNGRKSDELLTTFLEEIPGDGCLPARWRCDSHDQFVRDYGHLGLLLWSASANSHLLVLNGRKILRIWTDAVHHCWVEGEGHTVGQYSTSQPVPSGNHKKSKPFKTRMRITNTADMSALAKTVKTVYGIE